MGDTIPLFMKGNGDIMAQVNWEEKIKKAEETARKKAEKDGLDAAATQKAVEDAVAKVKEAQAKAEEAAKKKVYIVTVTNNPNFVGVGAGGIQFANGEARTTSERMAAWFREHPGYEVKEVAE